MKQIRKTDGISSNLTLLVALCVLTCAGCVSNGPESAGPVVRIGLGRLQGATLDGVERFLNIPYAAAPIGERRWRAPSAAPAWTGIRDAASMGPACPQPLRPAIVAGGVADRQSEDCLQLNIWRPRGARELPVIVWIHGGAHVIGSGTFPIFDGANLARQGAIVITINYRLGLLGYFAHPALTAEAPADAPLGNYGMMDQLAALRWVKENVAAFGGDPARVTVMGESAGAIGIAALLANPRAKGLFAQAIVQSSIALNEFETLAEQEQAGADAVRRAGLDGEISAADLRALPIDNLLAAQGERSGGMIGLLIDGRLIAESPWRAILRGEAIDVPLLTGANSNEASVILAMGVPSAAARAYVGPDIKAARKAYGADLSEEEFSRQVLGDAWFVAPTRWLAERTAAGAPTFLYHFDYVAAAQRNVGNGAAHGSEIAYIFQTLDYLEAVTGRRLADEDREFARAISACWIAFAALGEPDCALVPEWPAYDAASDRLALIGRETRIVPGFRKPQVNLLLERLSSALAAKP